MNYIFLYFLIKTKSLTHIESYFNKHIHKRNTLLNTNVYKLSQCTVYSEILDLILGLFRG